MLESIKGSGDFEGIEIKFNKKNKGISNKIYGQNIDSVNLILGKNGIGKTSFIRSLIESIDKKDCGIIYYSSSKFHERFKDDSKENENLESEPAFIDVSDVLDNKEEVNFDILLRKNIEMAKFLNFNLKLKSKLDIDFEKYALNDFSPFLRGRIEEYKKDKKYGEEIASILTNDLVHHRFHSNSVGRYKDLANYRKNDLFSINKKLKSIQKEEDCLKIKEEVLKLKKQMEEIDNLEAIDQRTAHNIAMTANDWENPINKDGRLKGFSSFYVDELCFFLEQKGVNFNLKNGFEIEIDKDNTIIKEYKSKEHFTITDNKKIRINEEQRKNMDAHSYYSFNLLDRFYENGFIDFYFGELSAGEAALSNQTVSIASGVYRLAGILKKKNILIFIDEGDNNLHIQRQCEYIKIVCEKIISVIKLGCSIQLVFATHSPFLAMDVFKENILCLENENGKFTHKEAEFGFGASIHDLVKYSFGGSLFGEISKKQIKRIYNKYTKGMDEKGENGKDFKGGDNKKIFNAIDDPYIKQQLSIAVSK